MTRPVHAQSGKKWSLIPLIVIFVYSTTCHPQDFNTAVYVEFATKQPVYSINYDRVFLLRDVLSYSFRVGLSVSRDEVYLPVGVNVLQAKSKGMLNSALPWHPLSKAMMRSPQIQKIQTPI